MKKVEKSLPCVPVQKTLPKVDNKIKEIVWK